MASRNAHDDAYTLEEMIDQYGLPHLIEQIADVCAEKAEHIRESYSPRDPQAQAWVKAAKHLEHVRVVIARLNL
ncbi:MAG: hypothetical protein ACYCUI_11565 [Vulcanimicrobiaceae bacterium]